MTMPTDEEFDPWEAYEPAYPGILTSVSDPTNAMFIEVPEPSAENPVEDKDLDANGLTDDEYDMIFRRPAADVPVAIIASAWAAEQASESEALQSRMPRQLQDYWLRGEGAARIRWGTEGSFRRCTSELREHFPSNVEGLCANLYHEATGHWPGEKRDK